MPISLLTDFGLKDGYAGILKGVISNIAPKAEIIDISHEIEPFNILQAGFVLYQSYRYFPKGTIFLTIVDPGVGSRRKPILIQTKDYYFIGPDNGVFSLVLSEKKIERIVHLQNSKYFLNQVSSTFHGRDLFAPVAAHLFRGISLSSFGPTIKDYHRVEDFFPHPSPQPSPRQGERVRITGKVFSIDRFGNLITNLKESFLREHFPNLNFSLTIKAKKIQKIYSHYAEGKKGEVFLLFGSSRFLEIAMNRGSAAKLLKIKVGEEIKVG